MAYGSVNADLMTTSDGVSSSGLYGFKNRIINGAMVIDQRNAGASVTPTGSQYTLDRWQAVISQSSKLSVQQNAGSVTPPVGFVNYLGATSLSAYSIGSTDVFGFRHIIEGFNTADLAWGTANAQPITISFWVRSSLTGTFGLGLGNSGFSRAYPASYTISSANIWEYKTVTIAGDTTGTWLTNNGIGIQVTFGLGYGSSYSGTANTWNAGTAFMPTGATSVVGTNGATFYITGVQLEKGSTATSFDYRSYSAELAMCQRYYEIIAPVQSSFLISVNATAGSQEFEFIVKYLVLKRATATVTRVGTWTDSNCSGVSPLTFSTDLFSLSMFSSGSGRCYTYNNGSSNASFTVSAEL